MAFTATETGDTWQVLKDGQFFCMAENELHAQELCDSFNLLRTPSPQRYTAADVVQTARPANSKTRRFLGFEP